MMYNLHFNYEKLFIYNKKLNKKYLSCIFICPGNFLFCFLLYTMAFYKITLSNSYIKLKLKLNSYGKETNKESAFTSCNQKEMC